MGKRGRDDRSIVPGPGRARFAFAFGTVPGLGDCVNAGRARARELVCDAASASGPAVAVTMAAGGEGRLPATELPKKASSLAWAWFCAAPPSMLSDASRPSRDGELAIAWLSGGGGCCALASSALTCEPAEPLRNCCAVARVGDVGGVVRSVALLASVEIAKGLVQLWQAGLRDRGRQTHQSR